MFPRTMAARGLWVRVHRGTWLFDCRLFDCFSAENLSLSRGSSLATMKPAMSCTAKSYTVLDIATHHLEVL